MESQPRYFLDRDDDGHWFLVPDAIRGIWEQWLELPGDDERAWTPPKGAQRLSGHPNRITFTGVQYG